MYDVLIIGSGPAAYTAAIYTSRALLKTLLLTGTQPGGQLTTTTVIENFPGFPDGIGGFELMEKMKKQAARFGTQIVIENVTRLQRDNGTKGPEKTFSVITNSATYTTRSVIVAVGAQARMLGIPSEEKFRGKGISYCATCDGFFYKGKNVAVIGGGDTAMEEALFLTRFADKVTIIHRRDEFRASPIMVERAKKNPKISFLLNKEVVEFIGEETVKGIRLRNNPTNELKVDGVFVAVGHEPATAFLKGFVELDSKGYIIVDIHPVHSDSGNLKDSRNQMKTQTSVEGVFAAGDCVDSRYRQAIVAAGMGCQAALDVQKYLDDSKGI